MLLEETWNILKNTKLQTARETCGVIMLAKTKQNRQMVESTIAKGVKIKKNLWRQYLGNHSQATYGKYKKQRTKVRDMVNGTSHGKNFVEKWNQKCGRKKILQSSEKFKERETANNKLVKSKNRKILT